MFLTKNFICFYSKIITHETILIIKFNHINSITKSMQFLIFPTQIRIETRNSIYSFTSFRSRSNTLDHLSNLLLQSRQREANNIDLLNSKENFEQLNKTFELCNKIEMNDTLTISTCNRDTEDHKINEKKDSNEQINKYLELNETNDGVLINLINTDEFKNKNPVVKPINDYSHLNHQAHENHKISNNYI